MPRGAALYVRGYKELAQASLLADRKLRSEQRNLFRKVGEPIRNEAQMLLGRKYPASAAGLKIRVRQRGVIVEQSLRKTTGKHPEWGKWQMKHALLPAQTDRQQGTLRLMQQTIDEVCDLWERSYPVR